MSRSIRWLTGLAFHEAGHVVVGAAVGVEMGRITISNEGGLTRSRTKVFDHGQNIAMTLAGYLAERRYRAGDAAETSDRADCLSGASEDIAALRGDLRSHHLRFGGRQLWGGDDDESYRRHLRYQLRVAAYVVRHGWHIIDAVAGELLCSDRQRGYCLPKRDVWRVLRRHPDLHEIGSSAISYAHATAGWPLGQHVASMFCAGGAAA